MRSLCDRRTTVPMVTAPHPPSSPAFSEELHQLQMCSSENATVLPFHPRNHRALHPPYSPSTVLPFHHAAPACFRGSPPVVDLHGDSNLPVRPRFATDKHRSCVFTDRCAGSRIAALVHDNGGTDSFSCACQIILRWRINFSSRVSPLPFVFCVFYHSRAYVGL